MEGRKVDRSVSTSAHGVTQEGQACERRVSGEKAEKEESDAFTAVADEDEDEEDEEVEE